MIRRAFPVLFTLCVVGAFLSTLVFLYKKSQARTVVYEVAKPFISDIVKKTVAPGAIVPRREVAIKSRVSGVVEKLLVEPGQYVKDRALIARIQIIPNVVNLNNAEAGLKSAEISFDTAKHELERYQKLYDQKLVSETDFVQQKLAFELRQQELDAAQNNLQLVKDGASRKSGMVSNQVLATAPGMVLEVPVREGSVIFDGHVDESEVGKLKEGMPVSITIGALNDRVFKGKLEYIAPKGTEKDGTIQFEVKAALDLEPGQFVRANYSANADIILAHRDKVLTVDEGWVKYEKNKTFVEVEVGPQEFRKRPVVLGLSDGIKVEVVSGLELGERVKKQEPIEEAPGAGKH
jgi:HlyD family secretion protein